MINRISTGTRILAALHDAADAVCLEEMLYATFPDACTMTHVTTLHELMAQLPACEPDILIMGLNLGDASASLAVSVVRHNAPHLPIVIYAGQKEEVRALEAMRDGARDFLIRETCTPPLLGRAVRYALQRQCFDEDRNILSGHDAATGLVSRSLFENRLQIALARGRRFGETPVMFQLVLASDDSHDATFKEAAVRLKKAVREYDTIAHFGDGIFAVLLESLMQPRDCVVAAEKLMRTLSGGERSLVVHTGIVVGTPDLTTETIMRHADEAAFLARTAPQRYRFYAGNMYREMLERFELEQALIAAIRTKEGLCLYYQPRMDIVSGRLVGAEALIRWEHETRGLLGPAVFMPLLSGTPLATELDTWVLETVCRDIRCWQATGLKPPQVSVHLSNQQWENTGMGQHLTNILENAGLTSECLALEVEESVIIRQAEDGFASVSRVRELGIEVHLDNFGAQLSSLKLLTRCPLDVIKIDRQLTAEAGENGFQATLVKALIDLGHHMGMKIVAEGVESEDLQDSLASMQCEQIQGMIISMPLPSTDFFSWMASRAVNV